VKTLQHGGFEMQKVPIAGRDYLTEERVAGYVNVGDRAKLFDKLGASCGRIAGIVFGAAFMVVPVVGHVAVHR
jgi:hypothetical protein